MPNKRKNKGQGAKNGRDADSDNDTVFTDNVSVVSEFSTDSYMKDEIMGSGGAAAGDDEEELTQDEIFDEKLRELLDLAEQKSANGRVDALKAFNKAFAKKLVPDFVDSNQETVTSIVKKALMKGKSSEQVEAAKLATNLCIQQRGSEDVYADLATTLKTKIQDVSAPVATRAACTYCLSELCFLSAPALAEVQEVMASLEKVFNKASVHVDKSQLVTSALSSWTLLATLMPRSVVESMLLKHGNLFSKLLELPDVDLKIATGEAVAVLYEYVDGSSGSENDDYNARDSGNGTGMDEVMEDLLEKLNALSTGAHKGTSKKDKKSQKSSVREILGTIQDDEEYYEKIMINSREKLELVSWAQKTQYEALARVLGSGTNMHLTQNEFTRDIFGLGAPIPMLKNQHGGKPSKTERHAANLYNSKIRNMARGKNRDKRSAVF